MNVVDFARFARQAHCEKFVKEFIETLAPAMEGDEPMSEAKVLTWVVTMYQQATAILKEGE